MNAQRLESPEFKKAKKALGYQVDDSSALIYF